jgi:hypothetical protein
MKGQINALNIIGFAISASLIVCSYFLPFRRHASKIQKVDAPHISKPALDRKQIYSQNNNKIPSSVLTATQPTQQENQVEKSQKQIVLLEHQNQEPTNSVDKSQQPSKQTNGCPKNLDYFTKKPRPKQTPEECFTCKNLITCVCLTSNSVPFMSGNSMSKRAASK